MGSILNGYWAKDMQLTARYYKLHDLEKLMGNKFQAYHQHFPMLFTIK